MAAAADEKKSDRSEILRKEIEDVFAKTKDEHEIVSQLENILKVFKQDLTVTKHNARLSDAYQGKNPFKLTLRMTSHTFESADYMVHYFAVYHINDKPYHVLYDGDREFTDTFYFEEIPSQFHAALQVLHDFKIPTTPNNTKWMLEWLKGGIEHFDSLEEDDNEELERSDISQTRLEMIWDEFNY